MPIPDFDHNDVLPPHVGDVTISSNMSPYSHQRGTAVWKGMLHIDLMTPNEDNAAREHLAAVSPCTSMSTLRELQERRAEIAGLKDLLASAGDELFERPLLQSKIEAREKELDAIETRPSPIVPNAELLFGGRAIAGSLGIDAKFASVILDSYQDMVSNHHGARLHPAMKATGRRPGESESRLYLTALPRGSFGLSLTQPLTEDFVAARQISEAMDELTSLVESAAAGDASFAQGVERFHPRVLAPLGKFLDAVSGRDASVTIRSGLRETILRPEQVHEARNRVEATVPEITSLTFTGVFRGVLLESWKFDFVPSGQAAISGALSESVTDAEARAMVSLCDMQCSADLRSIRFRTHGNLSRPSYELFRLRLAESKTRMS